MLFFNSQTEGGDTVSRKKPLKNSNGDGSVVFLGKNRRKPYGVRITIGVATDSNGNTRQKFKYLNYFETFKEAEQFRNLYNLQKEASKNPKLYEQYNLVRPKSKTFSALYYEWINFKYKGEEKHIYKYAFKRLSALHNIPISDITSAVIQDCLDNLATRSQATMDHNSVILKGVFEYAISIKEIDKDYSRFCNFKGNVSNVERHRIFTTCEIETLWKNKNNELAQVLLCMIYTGVRIEEFISIESKNVFPEQRYMVGGVKTAAGIDRIIPLCECILPFIKNFLSKNENYLYCYISGKRGNDSTLRGKIKEYTLQLFGYEHLPHDTRHTFATLMHNAGADETTTKRIIGHKIKDITKGVYTTITLEKMLLEISKINH